MSENLLGSVTTSSTSDAPPPSQATDTSASGATAAQDSFSPPEWAKGLSVEADILKAPMFNSVKSIDDVVKGYYHAQKMVGADKVIVPNKNSSAEEWKNYYIKAGLPEKFEDYKVELTSFEDENFRNDFVKTAYENNIRPDQLQKMVEMFDKYNEKIVSDYDSQQQESVTKTAAELKSEWGQGFDKQLARANRVIKHFGGDELHKAVLESDLANNGQFLRLMAKIGEKMTGEDNFSYETTSTFGMTKEEARSKMNAIFGDPNSPYFNSNHAQHKEFLDKMLKYQEILAGN